LCGKNITVFLLIPASRQASQAVTGCTFKRLFRPSPLADLTKPALILNHVQYWCGFFAYFTLAEVLTGH